MKTLWGRQSWLDYINWQHVERETAAKINDLVADDLKDCFRCDARCDPVQSG